MFVCFENKTNGWDNGVVEWEGGVMREGITITGMGGKSFYILKHGTDIVIFLSMHIHVHILSLRLLLLLLLFKRFR